MGRDKRNSARRSGPAATGQHALTVAEETARPHVSSISLSNSSIVTAGDVVSLICVSLPRATENWIAFSTLGKSPIKITSVSPSECYPAMGLPPNFSSRSPPCFVRSALIPSIALDVYFPKNTNVAMSILLCQRATSNRVRDRRSSVKQPGSVAVCLRFGDCLQGRLTLYC